MNKELVFNTIELLMDLGFEYSIQPPYTHITIWDGKAEPIEDEKPLEYIYGKYCKGVLA